MRKKRETRPVKRRATTNDPGRFRLPPGVSYVKERLSYGWAYVFRHQEIGQLGRIVLQGREDGRCHVTCEVVGDPDDPMTAQRMTILQPLTTDLMRRLAAQTGSTEAGLGVDPPPRPPEPKELIESKLMQCERCGAGAALLIFADLATDHGGLEDYARKMYPQVAQLNLPTPDQVRGRLYVIGPPVGGDPLPERPADILKIWPNREPVRRLRPAEFNPIIQELARAHCR